MGLRFRKSIKIAPGVKLNLNKKSTSVTFGGKGIHHTISSTGKRTSSIGIPGTGIYYTQSTSKANAKKNRKDKHKTRTDSTTKKTIKKKHILQKNSTANIDNQEKPKKRGCLFYVGIIFAIMVLLSMCSSKDTNEVSLEALTISADTDITYDINTTIPVAFVKEPDDAVLSNLTCNSDGGTFKAKTSDTSKLVFSASKPGSYTIFISDGEIKSNKLIIHVVDKDALAKESIAEAEKESKRIAESESIAKAEEESRRIESEEQARIEEETQLQTETQEPKEEMVWIPASGSKYHSRSSCSNMNNPTQITISQAKAWGYSPCKKCY